MDEARDPSTTATLFLPPPDESVSILPFIFISSIYSPPLSLSFSLSLSLYVAAI